MEKPNCRTKCNIVNSATSFVRSTTSFCICKSGMMLTYGQMMFATALQNDVVSYGHKHKKRTKRLLRSFFGSPCWARTSDIMINSSRLFLSIDFAGYIISDLPGNTGLCVSNGIVSRPSFSHSPKFHASFHASGKFH